MDSNLWFMLYQIFKMGGYRGTVFLATNELGKLMKISQQTASRKLLKLLKEGYIERELTIRGQRITITKKGLEALREVYEVLRIGFEGLERAYCLKGVVFTGFGEGAYYVTRSGYSRQFEEKLGFKPYPGTLNLRLKSPEDIKIRRELELLPGILIEGFMDEGRSYGNVKCFKARIFDEVDGALLIINRTHYGNDVIELISEENLRKKFGLKDGDVVFLKVII
ncbi:MAG: DUF120 domain-containing protein [Candidatus Methanomethyliaceae archaeon]|nr:DUF120 domain-containing protein [Candidatus Methanomethyliaceae archaeon]MCX8170260.1 DUF120 domain-containing protein [Candidatus Methanomethyliaceae archaeon]MDW7971031.1 DUF120 domain-containing protein [Nitrososphaerota archaeon]